MTVVLASELARSVIYTMKTIAKAGNHLLKCLFY